MYENEATLVRLTGSGTGSLSSSSGVVAHNWDGQHIFRIVPHLQTLVGLGWMGTFSCKQYALGINVGWEVNQFWNVPMATYPDVGGSHFTNRQNRSHNLALSGLNVDVRFDF